MFQIQASSISPVLCCINNINGKLLSIAFFVRHWSNCFTLVFTLFIALLIESPKQTVLQKRKLRHREIKELAWDHRATNCKARIWTQVFCLNAASLKEKWYRLAFRQCYFRGHPRTVSSMMEGILSILLTTVHPNSHTDQGNKHALYAYMKKNWVLMLRIYCSFDSVVILSTKSFL